MGVVLGRNLPSPYRQTGERRAAHGRGLGRTLPSPVLRLVNGALHMGVVLAGFVLQQELVGPEFRALTGNLSGCFFSVGLMLLAGLANLCGNWRALYGVTAALGCSVPLLWL